MTAERWLPVVGYEGLYKISNLGRLYGSRRMGSDGRILSVSQSKPCGYMRTRLYKDGRGASKKVHRLVLEAFVGPCPPKMECRHKNGKRHDNRLTNLRWGTRKDNCADAKSHGTSARGERNGHAKLSREKVVIIKRLRASGHSYQSIANRFNVTLSTTRSAAIGETWV